jgi:hypothetical protein
MLRVLVLLAAALALVGPAHALPLPSEVGVGPDGLEGSGDPYYLEVAFDPAGPEPPHAGAAGSADCAASGRPSLTSEAEAEAAGVVAIVAAYPTTLSLSPAVPTCVATPGGAPGPCPPPGCPPYASYDVATGRYYLEPGLALPHHGVPTVPGFTGTIGVGILADCDWWPPPDCC